MGAFFASFSAIFTRLVTEAPPLAIGFYRLLFALPFFAIPCLIWHRKELLSISKRMLAFSMLGGFFLAMHFFSWFTGVANTTVASAVVLCAMHPVFILLLSALVFHEKTNCKVVIGVIVALIGGLIITGGDYNFSKDAIFGDLMSLAAAFFLALYYYLGNRLRKRIHSVVYIFLVFISCLIVFAALILITKTPLTGYSIADYFSIFAMSMFCQIGAHAVFNWCLGYVSPLYISTTETGESIIATIIAVVLFAEYPAIWQIIGGIITLLGLLYYNNQEARLDKMKNVDDSKYEIYEE